MRLLEPTWIRDNVDYSFGDESGMGIGGYMKVANSSNQEFIQKYWECVNSKKPFMTLFIDNIRLYRRDCIRYTAVEQMKPDWRTMKDAKVQRFMGEDLLSLLSTLPNMPFIIFTGFEDTPTDEGIWTKIPDNVLGIYASNAMIYGGKVYPIPYGLQRKVAHNDNRLTIIPEFLHSHIQPEKLLYANFNTGNHPSRPQLANHYRQYPWASTDSPPMNGILDPIYRQYLTNIKRHKFMLCPSGNADGCECHRDWEAVYMRRVPVLQKSSYLEIIFRDIPVLFVDNLMNVTEQLLIDNDYLYHEMQSFDLNKLDIEYIYNKCINRVTQQASV